MSDKNKKGKDKDLEGFEEVMDLVHHEKSRSERERQRRDKHDPYELYNFLELENLRLQRLEVFFNDKVQNLVENPTTEELCEVQQEQIEQTRKQLWSQLHAPESAYIKNLRLMFNNVFS